MQRGYILPKNSDLNRTRPIVSFAAYGGKRLGGYVARAIGVMNKFMKGRWKCADLVSIGDAKVVFKVLEKGKWRRRIRGGGYS